MRRIVNQVGSDPLKSVSKVASSSLRSVNLKGTISSLSTGLVYNFLRNYCSTYVGISRYSYSLFNRKYDKEILNAICNIKKVYLQVLPKDFSAIKTRMQTLRELPEIELIDDQSQFYVPHECASLALYI